MTTEFTLDYISNIIIGIIKYNEGYKILSDIASDENFEYLESKHEFFENDLKQLLSSYADDTKNRKKYIDIIKPVIDEVNDILEAFENVGEEYIIDIFEKIKKAIPHVKKPELMNNKIIDVIIENYEKDIYTALVRLYLYSFTE